MNINPYESPRPGEPVVEHGMGNSDPVVRLLIEIRDGQREALDLQREALERTRNWSRFSFVRVVPFIIIMISSFVVLRLTRYAPPAPRPATRATPTFPTPPPSPPPSTFR